MTNDDGELTQYKRFRETGMALNALLVKRLSRGDIRKCGKDIGLLVNGKLVFHSEHETSILMDYCIHRKGHGKKSYIDQFINQSPYAAGSDEAKLLKAYRTARYTLVFVKAKRYGYLVDGFDILAHQDLSLVDTGLGQTAVIDSFIATRLMGIPDSKLFMSTGATIPVGSGDAIDGVEQLLKKYAPALDSGGFSATQAASFEKQLIRMLLRTQSQDNIQYQDVGK